MFEPVQQIVERSQDDLPSDGAGQVHGVPDSGPVLAGPVRAPRESTEDRSVPSNLHGGFGSVVSDRNGTSEVVGRRKIVSLFSGCGGMDLGFLGGFEFGGRYYCRLPYEVVWANDLSASACATYRLNLGHDIRVGDIEKSMNDLPEAADVVIGGFPCQDVSINGAKRVADSMRTILYRTMIEVVRRTQPIAFVAENVKGLLMSHGQAFFERMLDEFDLPGYAVNHKLYLAADYGVPQMRERILIVGVKGERNFIHPEAISNWITASEALQDLESLHEDPAFAHVWSKAARSPEQGARYLKADRPATTIRAEHHGNVQWHYRLRRRISLREAARLQSFPDRFQFPAGMRETERQIGNAVPPVLAWHVADRLREHLDTE